MWGQNRGSVEDTYPRRYSPSPLQNLRQGIKQSLLFALLAISLHHLYAHTQRFNSTVAMPLEQRRSISSGGAGAGVFGTAGDDHAQACGDFVEPFGLLIIGGVERVASRRRPIALFNKKPFLGPL